MVSREARVEAVKLLIRLGWNPPRPSERVTLQLIEDLETVQGNATLVLSPSEQRVIAFAARGYSEQETADALGIGRETVHTQRKNARQRLGAKNMPHAVWICCLAGNPRQLDVTPR
jgi:DNA-binding CsgD family transcriptional regulator